MTIHLDERYLEMLKVILRENLKNGEKVYIFGSRSNGKYLKKFSDIDIAVDNSGEEAEYRLISKLSIEFIDSNLPYKVDVLDLNSIDEKFRKIIEKDLQEITY